MAKKIAFASETYLLKVEDLLSLEKSEEYVDGDEVVVMVGDIHKGKMDKLYSGYQTLIKAREKKIDYVDTKVGYHSIPAALALLVQLVKPLKRRCYGKGSRGYGTFLSDIQKKKLMKGRRDAKNAYQLTSKRWAMSEEKRSERYEKLYNSLKENGFDHKYPIDVLANRILGVKDQLFQGHHRINICEELGIDEVAVRFWYAPRSPELVKWVYNLFKGRRK